MLTSPAPVVDLVRRRREPVVVRTLRSTAAAVLASLAGPWLSGDAQPLHLAPRVEEFAVTGMLVLGVGGQRTEAVRRVIETLIGAAVGVLLNTVVAQPVYVQPAGEAIRDLAARQRLLLLRIGDELVHGACARRAAPPGSPARRERTTLGGLLRSLRSADCGGGGAVEWIRAGAGRSAAPDDEEHIASWEEQCGTGY
ncbi:hypothetical protein ABZS96_08645 [Streptomyces avermitilis]|uniref:hypothetical protein n=1 Tax=Streptomyces avermitilis TaxID=33903 RepID=UPI0033B8F78F